jgi:hypothetical protein
MSAVPAASRPPRVTAARIGTATGLGLRRMCRAAGRAQARPDRESRQAPGGFLWPSWSRKPTDLRRRSGPPRRHAVRTARRYRTIEIRAGNQTLTAEDPLPDDLHDTLDRIHHQSSAH